MQMAMIAAAFAVSPSRGKKGAVPRTQAAVTRQATSAVSQYGLRLARPLTDALKMSLSMIAPRRTVLRIQ